jgi:hypothetical protein
VLCCPGWFPGTAKDLAKKRTCSKASKKNKFHDLNMKMQVI